jgi:twitching motility protein PilT
MQLNKVFDIVIKNNASDLHLSAGMPPILRIDGDLIPIQDMPVINAYTAKTLIYSLMDKTQQKEFEEQLELDFAIAIPNLARFRVNVFNQNNGMAAVFRVIPESAPTLDSMDSPPIFKKLLELPAGLILITGATGSGKTTTLAAMIDYINTNQSRHVITIEDPIEFIHQSKKSLINQREVHRDTRDFNKALRSALREDPDVILVGEMRDLKTIRLALTAAETGHLVMATLHTSSASRAINRIVDVFPSAEKQCIRTMLSESLQAVICQSLVKKNGQGRVAAFEIMVGSSAIRNLIREDKTAQMYSVIQTSGDKGMCTFDQYLQKLVANQIIDKSTARDAAINSVNSYC